MSQSNRLDHNHKSKELLLFFRISEEITKAINDIKAKKAIEDDIMDNIVDVSEDVERFLSYVMIAESNDVM